MNNLQAKLDHPFTWGRHEWKMTHINSTTVYLREAGPEFSCSKEVKKYEFEKLWNQGEIEFKVPSHSSSVRSLSITESKKIEHYRHIVEFLKPLTHRYSSKNLTAALSSLHEKYPGSEHDINSKSTVYRRYKDYEKGKLAIDIVTKHSSKKRKSKFSPDQLSLISSVVDEHYLVKNGQSKVRTYDIYLREFKHSGLNEKIIKRSAFYNHLNRIDPLEVLIHRKGKKHAAQESRVNEGLMFSLWPLEYVEMDALYVNIPMITEEGNYDGTLIVYTLIDRTTRCVVGIHLETTGPKTEKRGENAAGYEAAIGHALLPKEASPYGKWPESGQISTLIMDPSAAATSNHLSQFIAALEITTHRTEAATPQKKPFVERVFRTFRQQFFSQLHGYYPSNERGEYDKNRGKYGGYTLQEIKNHFEEYILSDYHESPHRGLGGHSPRSAWKNDIRTYPLLEFTREHILRAYSGTLLTGTIQKFSGIQKNDILYSNSELQALLRKGLKNGIEFRYNTNDISKIIVIHPITKNTFPVTNKGNKIPHGTSLREHKGLKIRPIEVNRKPSSNPSHAPESMKDLNDRQKKEERKFITRKKKTEKPKSKKLGNMNMGMIESLIEESKGNVTKEYHSTPDNSVTTSENHDVLDFFNKVIHPAKEI